MFQTCYLNNDGSRWIYRDAELMKVVLRLPDGTERVRKVDYWTSFGNFGACSLRVRGGRTMGYTESRPDSPYPLLVLRPTEMDRIDEVVARRGS